MIIFLNWVYWSDIGSQNYTGLKSTTQQNICTLHHAPVAPSKVCLHLHFPLFAHLHLPLIPISFWLSHCCLYVCVIYMFVSLLLNPFTYFYPAPQVPSPLTAVSLFHISSFFFVILVSHLKNCYLKVKTDCQSLLVWFSGLSTACEWERWLVRFPVRAHAWVASQVLS